MDTLHALRISIVLDRRVEPQLTDLGCILGDPTIADVRRLALRLRAVLPAWRLVSLHVDRGASPVSPVSAVSGLVQRDGNMLRVDVRVVSHEPLLDASAASAEDARSKLEAVSCAFAGDITRVDTRICPTSLTGHLDLFPVAPWPPHWYCVCGRIGLDEIETCASCGRFRDGDTALSEPSVPLAA
jgi:hypothetical protein